VLVYLIKKLGYALITLYGVVTVIFFLFNFLPGDPARMMLGQNETAEQLAIVKKNMVLISLLASNTFII
jgi:peptide/nickel transport system permease protein